MLVIVRNGGMMKKINKSIDTNMKNKRRNFFKIAGITVSGLFLWSILPKNLFKSNEKIINDTRPKVIIHPDAVSRIRRNANGK
jgi:hypothetical protein